MRKFKVPMLFLILLIMNSCASFNDEIRHLEGATIFSISEDKESIVLEGVINSNAYKVFKSLTIAYPEIKKIEIIHCEGSINDEINLKLAKFIYDEAFHIHLKSEGIVASGGTDLFLAGRQRTAGIAVKFGVHSWAGKNEKATDFPRGHKYHDSYIGYYKSVGFTDQQAEDFYYFTINAASPEDVHWMTADEIIRFGILTQ